MPRAQRSRMIVGGLLGGAVLGLLFALFPAFARGGPDLLKAALAGAVAGVVI